MSDETTLLREKLNKLIIEIERLDIKLDSPAYDMTLGEYEQEREKLLDEFEQVIAATLRSGTLTAEQVREAIMSVDRWEKPMGNTGMTNTHLIIRDDGWQAIADELNARAERTCEIESSYLNDFTVKNMCWYEFEMKCGGRFSWDVMEPPKFCPNCGGEVKVVDA